MSSDCKRKEQISLQGMIHLITFFKQAYVVSVHFMINRGTNLFTMKTNLHPLQGAWYLFNQDN